MGDKVENTYGTEDYSVIWTLKQTQRCIKEKTNKSYDHSRPMRESKLGLYFSCIALSSLIEF